MNSDVQKNRKRIISQSELLNEKLHKLLKLSKYSELEEKFKRLTGLSVLEIGVINAVYYSQDIIFKDICERLKIPKTTLTSLINRLERQNYLKRLPNKSDKRSVGLELTEDGILAQQEHMQFEDAICNTIIMALGTDENRQLLFSLLDEIIKNIIDQTSLQGKS
jgi:DNA-binding MarR family transcriptional regulator